MLFFFFFGGCEGAVRKHTVYFSSYQVHRRKPFIGNRFSFNYMSDAHLNSQAACCMVALFSVLKPALSTRRNAVSGVKTQ